MKNILILTATTGAGHRQVAATLEQKLIQLGHNVIQIDFVREQSKMMEILVENGYLILAKNFPKIYGKFYKLSNSDRINSRFSKIIEFAHIKCIRKILKKIDTPDLIIGTHPFSINIINRLKSKKYYKGPFISFITDFEAHYTYISSLVDMYVTGSNFTKDGLIEKGISKEKIQNLGIPVSPKFYETPQKTLSSQPINSPFNILLMGGSMGLTPMKQAFINLMHLNENIKLTVVCGKNATLKKQLEIIHRQHSPNFDVEILGYTNQVDKLMDKANVMITKPGGLTVSEAIIKNLPMLIPYYIPGQETENLNFLTLSNIAIEIKEVYFLNRIIRYLINNPQRLDNMREQMKKMTQKHSPEKTIELIESFLL